MFKKFMSKKSNKKRGFTLIELIIVIAIIAILAAIAVPAFGKVRENATTSTNVGNARTIYSVVVAGIADGTIDVPAATTTTGTMDSLKDKGLANAPKPQGKGEGAEFKYTVDKDGNVQILIGSEVIYPES